MRDDFKQGEKEELAKRVCYRCSNPNCGKQTMGPQASIHGTVNLGVAAHITAASPGGKRYDPSMTSEERSDIKNGIWLCQNCAKLIDSDEEYYSIDLVHEWKTDAETFARNQIEVLASDYKSSDGSISFRYIIATTNSVVCDILKGDLGAFPALNPLLLKNQVLEFWAGHFPTSFSGISWPPKARDFHSLKEYFEAFPTAVAGQESSLPGFGAPSRRTPTLDECKTFLGSNSPTHLRLIEEGVPIESVIQAFTEQDLCGGSMLFHELVSVQSIWGIFLGMENLSKEVLFLENASGLGYSGTSLNLRPIEYPTQENNEIVQEFPRIGLKPGESAFIPIGSMLEAAESFPIYKKGFHFPWAAETVTAVNSGSLGVSTSQYKLLGPSILPTNLKFSRGKNRASVPIHHFNPNSLYFLSHQLMCGSCPYLFYISKIDNQLHLLREILVSAYGKAMTERIEIPNDALEIWISELKDETSYLSLVKIDNQTLHQEVELRKGDDLRIVLPKDSRFLEVTGYYETVLNFNPPPNPYFSRELVSRHLHKFLTRS